MAEITTTTKKIPKNKKHRKNSCFLSCFGNFSDGDEKYLPEIIDSGDRKKSRWFFSARFRLKKSVRETISVCNPPIFKKNRKQIKDVKSDDHKVMIAGNKRQIPASVDRKPGRFSAIVAVVSDQSLEDQKPRKAKCGATLNSIIGEPDKSKPATCHKSITDNRRRTLVASQPDPPVKKSSSQEEMVTISHTFSLPPLGRQVSKQYSSGGHLPVVGQKQGGEIAGKFGPITGISVLIVTLAVMLMWGRIFAIFSTAAWLYFVHYFKTVSKTKKIIDKSNSINMSFDSKEYKKKVILEGLLERKHLWSLK